MRLPSKVTNYRKSIFCKFPVVLMELDNGNMGPDLLFEKTGKKFSGVNEFIDTLDCLYALGMIELNEEGELTYVNRNSL